MSDGQTKPLADLGSETVTLIVGKKRKEFTVHKQLLCDSCGYFRGAFHSSFKEGHEGKMNLVEESEGAVAVFVEWLYRSRIRPATNETYLQDLFKLYVMAEKIILDELADRVMDAILLCFLDDTVYDYLTTEMASYMWENTKKDSPMRKFIMEALGHM
ncbi:btb poz domain containing protein [Rutstroemia sp. NJR-2017a BBW]|nr:btb poz domain containing protein [Rutstroemia sp. NJR-2017a BBW]